ncbi:DUF3137 domain-containing protein [Caulobacter sp. KR2-114]|uniref:DUF3137 domain-containing protein n=1 Tax=Caulobacter sp. KR2-114 TaxID=3400912 RepID=UPI003C10A411
MPSESAALTENPLSGAPFERLYETGIKGELEKREVERKGAMQTFRAIIGAGIAVLVMESGLTFQLSHGASFMPDIRLAVATLAIAAVLAYLPLRGVAAKTKRDVIDALCAPLGLTYDPAGTAPMFDAFKALRLVEKPDDSSFEDHFAGVRSGCGFALCEARLTCGSGKEQRTVFSGQLIQIDFPRKFLGTTVVLRDSGWLNRFECPPHLSKVGLEDPHFEKLFEVFGDDQVEARAILTPAFMQQLVDLEQAFNGNHIRCAFTDGSLLIAFEAPDRFEIGGMFSTLVDRKRVESIAGDIGAVFRLIDSVIPA